MRYSALYSALESPKIDDTAGIIEGVSVITNGNAKGHDFSIDEKTLKQVHKTALGYKGGVKVKMNHADGVETIVGKLKNFRIDGDKVRADLHLLKSDEHYHKIMEMAKTMPEHFGLSLSVPLSTEKTEDGHCLRCDEIHSVDLVDSPAANPDGLLSSNSNSKSMDSKFFTKLLGLPETATEDQIAAEFAKRTTPQTVDLAAITSAVKAAMPVIPTADLEAVKTELANLRTSNAKIAAETDKAERKALLAQASREGKVVALSDDSIYGNAEKNIQPVPMALLKELVANAQKTVALTSSPSLRVVNTSSGNSNGEPRHLDPKERAQLCQQARERAALSVGAALRQQLNAQ